ncbi:MAG: 50S ribosomal protein L35 [Planctomycetes bacterium]|nr:50S ribosomal protein L35 [Planctomycetota bacterium]
MPKMKAHKGLRKRVRLTSTGKVSRRKSFAGHLMSGKSGRRRQRLRRQVTLVGACARNVRRALAEG